MDGNLAVEKREEGFDLSYQDIPFVTGLRPDPTLGNFNLDNLSKNKIKGEFGDCIEYKSIYKLSGKDALQLRLKKFQETVIAEFQFLLDIENPDQNDSFYDTSFNFPTFNPVDSRWLTFTWGLRDGSEGHGGGNWPTALHGRNPEGLPRYEGYAPLLLSDGGGAVAISPLNQYMVSPLSTKSDGDSLAVCRGVHGSVPELKEGTKLKTVFVFGDDLNNALDSWGRRLLDYENSSPECEEEDLILEKPGHWNAFGGYYAELFNGYNEEKLIELADYFDEEEIPIGYFGLDLWYEYDEIGKATDYTPNESKYPQGLKEIVERSDRPFVMHLSALDPDNDSSPYLTDDEPDYESLYRDVAEEISNAGGICAWHDWLRSEQSFWKELRSNPEKAEEWFEQMARAFGEEDLPVMLCMETMGMLMESTKYDNVKYCRNSLDYIFKQKGQLGKLWSEGERGFFYETPQEFIEQQVLVGSMMGSLGIYPFQDLFITNSSHPESFDEESPYREALMSALSAGPVGFGDKVGEIDKSVLNRLVFPDGTLARPDEVYRPIEDSLGERVFGFSSKSAVSGFKWEYFAAANLSDWQATYSFDRKAEEEPSLFNHQEVSIVNEVQGEVESAEVDYYVFAPVVSGLGLIGFIDKFVTAPSSKIESIEPSEDGVTLSMNLTPEAAYRFGVEEKTPLSSINCESGEVIEIEDLQGITAVNFEARDEKVRLRFETE